MHAREARSALAQIAEAQRGLVTTQQAARSGVSRLDLSRLADGADATRLIRGVYRLAGSPEEPDTDLYAHWLAMDPARTADERANDSERLVAVSHRSAAGIHSIGDLPAYHHQFSSNFRKQTEREGVRVSQGDLTRRDVMVKQGMLVTTPERTIADLALSEPDEGHVADALADAVEARLVSRGSVVEVMYRAGVPDGGARVDRMLAYRGLDGPSLAARLSGVSGLTSAIEEILARAQRNANMAHTRPKADDATLAAAGAQAALAQAPWEELARATAIVRATRFDDRE